MTACGDRDGGRKIELVECRLPKLASAAQCGTVEVPEDRSRAGGRKIGIAVTVLPASTVSPKPDALFMFAGGPGQSADALAPLAAKLAGVRRNRDIVLVDPRGTGKSSPLKCEALAPHDAFETLLDIDAAATAARRCLAELREVGGADVAQYTTSALVADIDAARAALGYDKINLWGGSYGTRVAQEYLRRYPDRVRSLVLDSVAPPAMKIDLDVWPSREAAVAAVITACASDHACNSAYPDLAATLEEIRKTLAGERQVTIVDPRTGASRDVPLSFDVVIGALEGLVYAPELASLIPPLVARAKAGDYAPLVAAAMMFGDDLERTTNLALHYAVTCAEDAPRVTLSDAARLLATLTWPALAQRNLAACDGWPRPAPPPDFYAPVASDKPVLILSGGLDPVTPPANGEIIAKSLPNSRHVIAAGYGHIVSPHACAPRLIEKFIDDAGFESLPKSCLDHFAASKRPAVFSSLLEAR